jgi:hypothetical protein
MSIEQTVVEKLKTLPLEKQQEVLDFVEFLQAKIMREENSPNDGETPMSFLTLAQKFIGCVEGAADLSANNRHLDGYGA